MTLIEFLFAVVSVANTVLLSLLLLEVRELRRRQWAKEEHTG